MLGDPVMRSIVIVSTAVNLALTGPIVVGLPWLVLVGFGGDALELGLLFAAFGAGSLAGAVLGGSLRRPRGFGWLVLGLAIGAGVGLAAIGVAPSVQVAAAILLVIGVTLGYINVVMIAWVQEKTDPLLLGRTMSFMMLGSVVAAPLSIALAALLVDTAAPAMFIAAGALIVVSGLDRDRQRPAATDERGRGYHASVTESTSPPASLPFTGDPEADRLLAEEPFALLVGFALDQQVTVQKAFSGPAELKRRLGHLDPARIAAMDPGELEDVFRERPALHRFPGSMATKVQALAAAIARDYGNDAGRVWRERRRPDLEKRLLGLPGFGEMKVKSLIAVLGNRFGVRPPGYEAVAPTWPTLGDVDSAEALATYQAGKRAHKAAMREAAGN